MIGVLISEHCPADAIARMEASAREVGEAIAWLNLPSDPEGRLGQDDIDRISAALYSFDVFETHGRAFFSAVRKAPNLRWLHTFSAGVDHPIFAEMLARGMRLSTSAGTTAVPIAQSAITGLLMLARGFPSWLAAQRRHEWMRLRSANQPDDLAGQAICVLGLGSIGKEIARLAQALGMHVIGVRRGPRQADDPVAELHTPGALPEILPRCRWLAIACPLTPETRGMIGADALALLPQGACLINIARGEIVDETAMLTALTSGKLGGAYLDAFQKEPLAADAPFWDLPNVIVTPHSSGASSGNAARVLELFVRNFGHWVKGQPLQNEVTRAGT